MTQLYYHGTLAEMSNRHFNKAAQTGQSSVLGTKTILSTLMPHSSAVLEGESAVFAANAPWLAIFFIAQARDCDIGCGFINSIPYIMENNVGAFDKMLRGHSGYIYSVDASNFHSDTRLGLQGREFISKTSEVILESKFVPDIFEALVQSGINMIRFDDRTHPFWEECWPYRCQCEHCVDALVH